MKNFRIRKGDKVMIIAGKDNGKIGKVLKLLPKHDSVVVEKANMVKRHIHISNVMVVCSSCGKPPRVGYKFVEVDGKQKKVRFCKKCNEVME